MPRKRAPTFEWPPQGPGDLRDALCLPDGTVLSASSTGVIRWDATSGSALGWWLREPAGALALSPDGTTVAVMHDALRLTLHDLTGRERARLERPTGEPSQLRWGAWLVVCTVDGLWAVDPSTGEVLESWDAGQTWMLDVRDERVLHERMLFVPGREAGRALVRGETDAVALCSDGRAAIAVGKTITVLDSAGKRIDERTMKRKVVALAFDDAGELRAVLEGGWIATGTAVPVALPPGIVGEAGHVLTWRFDARGRRLLCTSRYFGALELHDLDRAARVGTVEPFGDDEVPLEVIEVAEDRVLLRALHLDGQNTHESAALFTRDGQRLAIVAQQVYTDCIGVDRASGKIVVAHDDAVRTFDAKSGAREPDIPYPDEDDSMVTVQQGHDGHVEIELDDDERYTLDYDARTLVPVRRTGRAEPR